MPTLVASSEDTRVYETCILYPHPLGQKEEAELLKEIKAVFDEAKAVEISRDAWGRRGLAYDIGGFTQGNFLVLYHEMEPANLKELDNNLKLVAGILRHITIKPPKGYEVVEYSKQYGEWKKDVASAAEEKKKEREERLKKRMLKKQRPNTKKDDKPKQAPTDTKKLSADIDSLLDSKDLTL